MEHKPSAGRLGAASILAAAALACALPAAAAAARPTPQGLYQALLKKVPDSSLPYALRGSATQSAKLSKGSRAHHAVGAVEVTNGQALVGFLVFHTKAEAVADLKAYPPNRGPNKIVTLRPAGFPQPAYLIHAQGNGYEAAYLIYVHDNVIVNAWAYGQHGTTKKLYDIVRRDARWAKQRLTRLNRG